MQKTFRKYNLLNDEPGGVHGHGDFPFVIIVMKGKERDRTGQDIFYWALSRHPITYSASLWWSLLMCCYFDRRKRALNSGLACGLVMASGFFAISSFWWRVSPNVSSPHRRITQTKCCSLIFQSWCDLWCIFKHLCWWWCTTMSTT